MHDAKQRLRESVRSAVAQLDAAERRVASRAASERLLRLPEVQGVRTVLLYSALPDECDPGPAGEALLDAGVRVLLPRVVGDDLHLVRARRDEALVRGAFGILEPVGPRIDADQVDVAVVPGLAFDRTGGRLGRGRGFYDRLLPTLRPDAARFGFCFADQLVPRVPVEDHDVRVHAVVTDRAVHRPRSR